MQCMESVPHTKMHPTASHKRHTTKSTKNGETLSVALKVLRFKGALQLHPEARHFQVPDTPIDPGLSFRPCYTSARCAQGPRTIHCDRTRESHGARAAMHAHVPEFLCRRRAEALKSECKRRQDLNFSMIKRHHTYSDAMRRCAVRFGHNLGAGGCCSCGDRGHCDAGERAWRASSSLLSDVTTSLAEVHITEASFPENTVPLDKWCSSEKQTNTCTLLSLAVVLILMYVRSNASTHLVDQTLFSGCKWDGQMTRRASQSVCRSARRHVYEYEKH